jgi:CubicO group peptidase (beta-lactamase class C family)
MQAVDSIVERAISSHAFPAAVIEVGRCDGVLWRRAYGRLTYAEDAPLATHDTIFDLASLTKVIATATVMMRAVDAGAVAIDDRLALHLPTWRGIDREAVTIADVLEHTSGLTAYLPFFRDHRGRAEFERAICALPLEYMPRTQTIYSDLGFILLGFILDDCGFRLDEMFPLTHDGPFFNPSREIRDRCAPTELDLWRGRLLQGEVHDENTWVLGGVAGHAGLFGRAPSVGPFARRVLGGLKGGSELARPQTLGRFVQKSRVPGSSRALGWDTMLPSSSCGTLLSPRAIGHTGFTGTSLWIDPEQDLYVVFLTNRVHPTRDNNAIQPVRRAAHDAIVRSIEQITIG